jgi:hypothetical protein
VVVEVVGVAVWVVLVAVVGGVGVVESEGGEHGTIVAGRQNREEADR